MTALSRHLFRRSFRNIVKITVNDIFSLSVLDMENLYEILQCDPASSQEQIKQSFRRLALEHHPDKKQSNDNSFFVKLNNAWEILGNKELRREYDMKWRERSLVQELPIQEEVAFSDFITTDFQDYKYPCRCGDEFILSETDAKLKFDLICCETCSLTIRVHYDDMQQEPNYVADKMQIDLG